MSDLFEELKEDLSREKYARIWQKFGNYFIGAAIAALILTALGVAGKRYMDARYDGYSDKLYEANNAPKSKALAKYDDLIATGDSTYRTIAMMRKAVLLLENNNQKDALSAYKKVALDSSAPREFRDIAKLIYVVVSHNMAINHQDEDVDAKLFLQDSMDASMVKYSAMEVKAFQQLDKHNYTKAKDIFNSLVANADVPSSIKDRATEMLDAIANMNELENKNPDEKTNS